MNITPKHLNAAVEENIINADQARQLIDFFARQPDVGPSFTLTHVLYYFAGLIAIGAMSLFMTLGWEAFGGWGIFSISLAYACIGLMLCRHFQRKGFSIPAGICATFVVVLTPLAIYGLQQALGLWPDSSKYREYHLYIKWHWLYMELGTLIVGCIMAWRFKYPFLLMPIAITLWYMTMDVAAMVVDQIYGFDARTFVSMNLGLLIVFLALWIDIRSRHTADYAFWLYIVGALSFWGALTILESGPEISKHFYFFINVVMIGIGALLLRRVFVVLGALGCCGYFVHLASTLFKQSWMFPIVLSAIGLLIIYLGIAWQKYEDRLTQKLRSYLPQPLRELLNRKTS